MTNLKIGTTVFALSKQYLAGNMDTAVKIAKVKTYERVGGIIRPIITEGKVKLTVDNYELFTTMDEALEKLKLPEVKIEIKDEPKRGNVLKYFKKGKR